MPLTWRCMGCLCRAVGGLGLQLAAGFPIVLFAVLPLPDWVPVNRELSESLKALHHWMAYALGAVITLHVAGALSTISSTARPHRALRR